MLFDSVEVLSGDLDGDGSVEIVVPILMSSGNGMGVSYWSVLAVSPSGTGWYGDTVEVEDYNTNGSWVAPAGEKGCDLLETKWVWHYDASRGAGLYLTAAWLRFSSNDFEPRADRPILRRRYLGSFEAERGRTATTTGPFSWLLSPQAHP